LGLDKAGRLAAEEQALKYTYQDASTAARIAQAIDNAAAATPIIGGSIRFLGRVAFSPYVRTPVNLFVEGAKFAMPAFGFAHAAVKASQGNTRDAQLSAAYATIGMTIGAVAEAMIEQGLLSGGPDEDKGTNLVRAESGMGYFRVNVSGWLRAQAGEDPSFAAGDTTIRLDSLGVTGYVMAAKAEAARINAKDPTQVPDELATQFGLDQIGNTMAMGRFAVNQTMLQGVSGFTKALERGDPTQWISDKVNLMTSMAMPNTIMAWRATGEGEMKANLLVPNNPVATVANLIEYKFGDRDNVPQKLDIFGSPISQTPHGQTPEVYHMMNHFKTEEARDGVPLALYQLYRFTGDDRVVPSVVSRSISFQKQRMALPADLYQSMYQAVQGAKGAAFVQTARLPAFQNLVTSNPAYAVDLLHKRYTASAKAAKLRWTFENRQALQQLSKGLKDYLKER
jgi:hypothetical protein